MRSSLATRTPAQPRWTVLSLIQWATQHLVDRGFDEARLHVELLLSHVLQCSRLELYTQFDRPMSDEELGSFKTLFRRRLAHEPLQYILGRTDFMGISLAVDRRVLIPRPETELLVEKTLEALKGMNTSHPQVLEIGTGSGNIAIAIARFAPHAAVTSIDISAEALELAKQNALANEVGTISFVHADVFDEFLPGRHFDVVVSNPPYISVQEFATLQAEVREFEPLVATTDNADGLTFIRRITELAAQRLTSGGYLLLEIAYNQSVPAQDIVRRAGLGDLEVTTDYAGHPRILSARK